MCFIWETGAGSLECVVCCLASADFCEQCVVRPPASHIVPQGVMYGKWELTSVSSYAVKASWLKNFSAVEKETWCYLESIGSLEQTGLQNCQDLSKGPTHTISNWTSSSRWNGNRNHMNLDLHRLLSRQVIIIWWTKFGTQLVEGQVKDFSVTLNQVPVWVEPFKPLVTQSAMLPPLLIHPQDLRSPPQTAWISPMQTPS